MNYLSELFFYLFILILQNNVDSFEIVHKHAQLVWFELRRSFTFFPVIHTTEKRVISNYQTMIRTVSANTVKHGIDFQDFQEVLNVDEIAFIYARYLCVHECTQSSNGLSYSKVF